MHPGRAVRHKTEHVSACSAARIGARLAEIIDVLGLKEHSVRALRTATIANGMFLPLVKSPLLADDALPAWRDQVAKA